MQTFWYLQNNYARIARMTAPVAQALRDAGREFCDFSAVPDLPLPWGRRPSDVRPFLYGSTLAVKRALENAQHRPHLWFDIESFDQQAWLAHRGNEMLNATGVRTTLKEVPQILNRDPCFVRPAKDLKIFAGRTFTRAEFESWRDTCAATGGFPDEAEEVWVAPAQPIHAEYRFFVGDHQVLVGSAYRVDGAYPPTGEIPENVLRAAQQFAAGWLPARLCVMDVALTANGPRIVEFNVVHASGRYHIPAERFVAAVEAFHASLEA